MMSPWASWLSILINHCSNNRQGEHSTPISTSNEFSSIQPFGSFRYCCFWAKRDRHNRWQSGQTARNDMFYFIPVHHADFCMQTYKATQLCPPFLANVSGKLRIRCGKLCKVRLARKEHRCVQDCSYTRLTILFASHKMSSSNLSIANSWSRSLPTCLVGSHFLPRERIICNSSDMRTSE